jgi:hypothetical protein
MTGRLLSSLASAWRSFFQGASGHQTPDVTRAQQLAIGQAVLAVLVVFGFDVDEDARQLVLGLAAVLAATLPISDAVVRQARAKNATNIQAARKDAAADDAAAAPAIAPEQRARLLALRARLEPRSPD